VAPSRLEAPKPVPKPALDPNIALLADKKKEEDKNPEPVLQEKLKPTPPKPAPPKETSPKAETPKPAPPKANPVQEALDKARAAAKTTPGDMRVKPNAVAEALAAARKQRGSYGEGEGEGGGGLGDVYIAQIAMAIQQNWHWPAQAKGSLSVALYLKIDAAGRVLDVRVAESSGHAAFDSSAVSAVRVTQNLPPPPSSAYREFVFSFYPMQ